MSAIKQREESEVDLQKVIKEQIDAEWTDECNGDVGDWIRSKRGSSPMAIDDVKEIARHFYELGKNAK